MAKRLIRYATMQSIIKSAPEIMGKKANIVLKDGQVVLATVLNISSSILKYQNMRLVQSEVDLNNIAEIIIDINA
ncbi:MAG TPA: hypothetical protein PKL31_13415 [Fulvivirga sp.]|nr:hypothetical protein [Fulvivirga sp.]